MDYAGTYPRRINNIGRLRQVEFCWQIIAGWHKERGAVLCDAELSNDFLNVGRGEKIGELLGCSKVDMRVFGSTDYHCGVFIFHVWIMLAKDGQFQIVLLGQEGTPVAESVRLHLAGHP